MTIASKEITDKNVIILEIPEKLNMDNSEELQRLIKDKVDDGHYNLIFDMMKTNYVDSTGLGAI
nr:STAS domain-containing protein [Nitrosopumilaceae archaeon]NIU86169.1 STAS domain-containing protein [Nitrosopumilaceae archaeon]NIV66711.1 STAS domain-containing protein [Nitrosopumilaceae archaeon]NIX60416.1 STAS domain-containing protein [Nitrosopumilaceae archaeon]